MEKRLPEDLFDMADELAEELSIDPDFDTSCGLMVVTGANAAGKSLLRRYIQMTARREYQIECIHISQEGRSTEGIMRAFVYGAEDYNSTGYISCHSLTGAISTSRKRDKPHMIVFDEPEIGMGEELQAGAAIWLREALSEWPEHLRGVVVMTHSRNFVREIMKFDDAKFYNMEGRTADEWLTREIVPVSPEEVSEIGHARFRRVTSILDGLKKKRKEMEGKS